MNRRKSYHTAKKALAVALVWLADCLNVHAQGTTRYVPDVNMGMLGIVGTFPWDANNDGTVDFLFQNDGQSLGIFPQDGGQVLALPSPPPDIGADVLPLVAPSEIGDFHYSPAQWIGSIGNLGFPGRAYFNSCSGNNCVGTFVGVRAYFGFSFEIEGQTHYGWAAFNASHAAVSGGILEEYAYNLTPNAPIFVGQVQEPSTLALLAIGVLAYVAFGIRRTRLDSHGEAK